MKIRRKGAGIAFTATLLASLVATVAAPLAFASVTVTGAGTVPRGGTSTGTVTFTFTENSIACFTGGGSPDLQVVITDANPVLAASHTVGFSGTATVVAPTATLGTVTATLANTAGHSNDTLNINWPTASNTALEIITVSGLKLTADSNAYPGAIKAVLGGSEAGCVQPSTTTAVGILQTPIPDGGALAAAQINVTSVCPFVDTGVGGASTVNFSLVSDPRSISGTSAVVAGIQNVDFAAGTVGQNIVPTNTVTQTVPACPAFFTSIGSPGTVANALNQDVEPPVTTVSIGQTNQPVADTFIEESTLGGKGTITGTITFTIAAAGVTFSGPPTANPSPAGGGPGGEINLGSLAGAGFPVSCSLSVDRKSCSVTATQPAVPAIFDEIELEDIFVDVDGTATAGTPVVINITTSTSIPLVVTHNIVAYVGRIVLATAAQPTVFIGQNDQATGTLSFAEAAPGLLSNLPGGNNIFEVCYTQGETFTRAPWAIVTAGDLKLLAGGVGVTQTPGTLVFVSGNACAFWQVYSYSTVASTIEIRGSDTAGAILPAGVNNGPRINVPSTALPGSVQGTFGIGALFPVPASQMTLFSNAIRAFQNNVTVTAASQPRCLPGATDCLAGNIVVTETQQGQLRLNTKIVVNILPRATTQRMDVLLQTTSTNQTPIVSTNAPESGLLVTPVGVTCTPSAIFGVVVCNFAVTVTQQAFGPKLGTLTFSNIHYVVAADAVNGPVLVNVTGTGGVVGSQVFDAVVSNAIIGAAPVKGTTKTSASSAVTKTTNPTLFSVGTKVVTLQSNSNNIVTIRIKVDPALVGKNVSIQRATKNSAGAWSAFVTITSRKIGSDGYAYYYASQHSALWASYRGMFLGNDQWLPSTGQTVQVRWK